MVSLHVQLFVGFIIDQTSSYLEGIYLVGYLVLFVLLAMLLPLVDWPEPWKC